MEKNKSFYMTLVVLVCSLFAFLGAFYLGTYFSVGKNMNNDSALTNDKTTQSEIVVPNYSEGINILLYNYLKNNNDKLSFTDYIDKGITNNQKLFVAGIFDTLKFNELEENLINVFGSTLNLKSDDFYLPGEFEAPLYIYNKDTNEYKYNEEEIFGSDVITDLLPNYIYNYKLDSISYNEDGFILTYYGLFASLNTVGPTCLSNNLNINRCLGYDSDIDGVSDDYYLSDTFNNRKDEFLKFSYIYKKVNKDYRLVDFKEVK